MKTRHALAAFGCGLTLFGMSIAAFAQTGAPADSAPAVSAPVTATPNATPTPAERIAAIKAALVQDMQNLKQYQWTETTVLNFKGEDKSNHQNTCYYGADSKVVKTPVAAPAADDKGKPGLRGKVIANKKEEMGDYLESAIALMKSYIPPDPAKLEKAKNDGKISMTVLDPGKRARLDIKDYQKPGDNLGVEIDMTTNKILGLSVASYLTDAKDAVALNVKMASLLDGTGYPETIALDGKAKSVKVTVTNSGYQKKS